MDVPVELSRILITELGDRQMIFLKETGGERTFPILIGIHEALAIDRRLKGNATPRPMTHELLAGVIEAMGGTLERIVIEDLRDDTFIATLHIRRGQELISVDSRPSDAIALGAAFDTPMFVAEKVFDHVTREPTTIDDRLNLLRERLKVLESKIGELSERLADETFLAGAPDGLLNQAQRKLEDMKSEYEAINRVLKKLG